MKNNSEIERLEAEVSRLKSELEKAHEREALAEGSRRIILNMMEEVNESAEGMERGKKEWEATFDAISDPLFIHDKEMRIVRANKAYLSASGEAEFKNIIGRPYYEVFPMMDGPFTMCLKAGELQEEEEGFSCPVTNRVFKIRFYPIKDEDGTLLYSIHILEDITEAKKAEERIKEEMSVTNHLLMIAEATIHTTDIDKLMEQVVHCGHEVIRCDICLSYLWDEESKVFQPCQELGLSRDMIPVFRTEPIDENIEFVRKAVDGREPVIKQVEENPPRSPFYKEGDKRLPPLAKGGEGGFLKDISTLAVAIPLIGKAGTLGLIVGIYSHPVELTERDKKIMVGISQQASVALEQARLYKESVDKTLELSHKIETIKVMREIDRSILSTLEPQQILETATRMIAKVVPCDRATVVSVDKARQMFTFGAGFGTPYLQGLGSTSFEDTSAGDVVKTGRTEYIANLADIKEPLPIEKGLIKEGFLSHIRVPLTAKGEITGLLSIGAKRPSAFTPGDLSTLGKLASQISIALENARLLTDLEELFIGTVKSLSSAIDAKSPWTAGHSERVTKYALDIAKQMGLSEKELKDLELAGLLHDVGKIGTYEYILDKPDRLTDEEVKIMRLHPGKGAEMLSPIKNLKDMIPAIRHHHEFYNGTGYPDGLKEEKIPLFARILAVADTADAMGADRPYKKGREMDVIIAELKRCSGTQFDPKVVDVFLKTLQNKPL